MTFFRLRCASSMIALTRLAVSARFCAPAASMIVGVGR
jgi:hypothetical protein